MWKIRIIALIILITGLAAGYFAYSEEGIGSKFPFQLGLDLRGGTHLVYNSDLSAIPQGEERDSMEALRDVIERRVNIFGVSEPLVQVEVPRGGDKSEGRLIVELPGVTNVDEAVALIGATPTLEFRTEIPDANFEELLLEANEEGEANVNLDEITNQLYEPTELTGRFLDRSSLQFDSLTGEPTVLLYFDKEGQEIFAKLTRDNIGKTIAIYLDGVIVSAPVVQGEITGGTAQITGQFTPKEARTLVGRLNSGALPIPITLLSTQTIGASLGAEAVERGVSAGLYGLIAVAIFFILWYRLPGLTAVFALGIYLTFMLTLFKFIPVTLTAAGIAGFILSIGIAVDANVLIFERIKEELGKHSNSEDAIKEGFARAWLSIRDANISSIITAIILFWFGTSLIKGFALTFGLGVMLSMFSAIVVTRAFILSLPINNSILFLFGSGLSDKNFKSENLEE